MFSKTEHKKYKYMNSNKEIEETIIHLFDVLVYRNNTYKDIEKLQGELPVFEKLVCVISSMSSLLELISDDAKEKLSVLLDKGDIKYHVNFIIADAAESMSIYSFESWFKSKVSLNDGIWLGNGLGSQFQFKISTMTKELRNNVEDDFGYVISKGKAKLVKLVSTANSEGDDIFG